MSPHHGDGGETSLFDGSRVGKTDPRIQALGSVDELNSWMGLVAAQWEVARETGRLRWIQERLLELGAYLANPDCHSPSASLQAGSLETLDEWLAEYKESLPPLRRFILPGGHQVAASLHVARSVCRRAECNVWDLGLAIGQDDSPAFLNRLSDVLFEMARWANASTGVTDPEWEGGGET